MGTMKIKLYGLPISAVVVKICVFLSIFFHNSVQVPITGLSLHIVSRGGFAVKPRTKFLSQGSLFLT